jgi:hypothetical protein
MIFSRINGAPEFDDINKKALWIRNFSTLFLDELKQQINANERNDKIESILGRK